LSPLLRDAWTRGDIRLETPILPHRYLDLTRLIGTA
jgi:hypothetical protein